MSLIRIILAAIFVGLGVAVSAMNTEAVRIDLYFLSFESSLGLALLIALASGAVLGGLALAIGILAPLRRRLALAREQGLAAGRAEGIQGDDPDRA